MIYIGVHFTLISKWSGEVRVAQPCLTLWSIHGILQARIEWVAFPFSRGSSQPRDGSQVSHIAGEFFANSAIGEALQKRVGEFQMHEKKRQVTCEGNVKNLKRF